MTIELLESGYWGVYSDGKLLASFFQEEDANWYASRWAEIVAINPHGGVNMTADAYIPLGIANGKIYRKTEFNVVPELDEASANPVFENPGPLVIGPWRISDDLPEPDAIVEKV